MATAVGTWKCTYCLHLQGEKSKLCFLPAFAGFSFCLHFHSEEFMYEVDVHLLDCNGVTAQMVTILSLSHGW
jgi:hypothetical protein